MSVNLSTKNCVPWKGGGCSALNSNGQVLFLKKTIIVQDTAKCFLYTSQFITQNIKQTCALSLLDKMYWQGQNWSSPLQQPKIPTKCMNQMLSKTLDVSQKSIDPWQMGNEWSQFYSVLIHSFERVSRSWSKEREWGSVDGLSELRRLGTQVSKCSQERRVNYTKRKPWKSLEGLPQEFIRVWSSNIFIFNLFMYLFIYSCCHYVINYYYSYS